jgi:hypothetical protein
MLAKNFGDYFFVNLLVDRSERNYPTWFKNSKTNHLSCCCGGANYHTRAQIATAESERKS